MYSLFNSRSEASLPVNYPANWHYVRTGLQANLVTTERYYHQQPFAVKADHFLIQLLQSITTSKTLDIDRYYDNIDGLFSLNLSMALRMTSSIYTGQIFKGTFYGPECDEILIAHTASFDPFKAEKYWKQLTPIRVLRHPKSDLNLNLPTGKKTSEETGLAVIAINIPMLAIQWRSFWRQEQYLSQQYDESPMSIMQFIHMYALPNMLNSQLDYTLFNRINNLERGAPMGESLIRHPFVMPDYAHKLNAVQQTNLDNLQSITRDFNGILYNIPAVSLPNMMKVMRTPDMAATRQVVWALDIARFPVVDFLTRVSTRGGFSKNGQEINAIRQAIRSYDSSSLLRTSLPRDIYQDTMADLADIKTRLI